MSSFFQVRSKYRTVISHQRVYLQSYLSVLSIQQKYYIHHNHWRLNYGQYKLFCTKSKESNKDDIDEELDDDDEEIKDGEKKEKEEIKFTFDEGFDDFESYQKRKKKDSSNYYHDYFQNKAKQENEENTDRKRLKKPVGGRKTDKEKREESETKRLNIEYKIIGGVILSFTALIGYYFYYISGSKIGKADTYYKTAIDYQLQCNEYGDGDDDDDDDKEERLSLIKNAEYYYKKALKYTDYSYPKYLYKYSEFLLLYKKDYAASEHYITKALGLHKTNAIYHQFYCKLLKAMIEENGNIERLQDYYSEKHHTVQSHINEATYFLSEENNEKAAIMHFDYALNFCDLSMKSNRNIINKDENIIKIDENVEDMRNLKIETYQSAAKLLQEYGFKESAKKYWDDGINEIGEPIHIRYGVFCYEQQRFDEANKIFDHYVENRKTGRTDITALVFKARILMEMGEYNKAMHIYSSILPNIGMDPMVIGDMVYILIETNKINEARNLMKQTIGILKKQRNTDDLMKIQGLNYINMINILLLGELDDIENANYQCLEMVNNYPNEYEVNYFAALYYHKYAKDYDKADRYYRNAISIEDQWAKTYLNYSLLFKQHNDLGQFIKYIKIAYEKNKKIPMIKELYQKYFDEEGRLIHTIQ